jgi:4-hydroxy-3-methylbut-2-enyl diphosphate reductase
MVKIITEYGYCYGVLNAVRILEESAKRKSKVYLTHTLIHNEEENRRLLKENHAVFYAPGMPLDSDTAVVFSAHGHPLSEEEPFRNTPVLLADATCPLIVARYQRLRNPDPEISYVFLGKGGHQETLGFLSHFPFLLFVDTDKAILPQLSSLALLRKSALIPQTTVALSSYETALSYLREKTALVFSLPICPHYSKRAEEAASFLRSADPMKSCFVVAGETISSNAKEIFARIRKENPALRGVIASRFQDVPSDFIGKDIYLASSASVSRATVERLVSDLRNASGCTL